MVVERVIQRRVLAAHRARRRGDRRVELIDLLVDPQLVADPQLLAAARRIERRKAEDRRNRARGAVNREEPRVARNDELRPWGAAADVRVQALELVQRLAG